VRVVRNQIGQLQALKEIQRARFTDNDPYEREFRGIRSYKPVSNQHSGLLCVDHVNRNEPDGYFYYVMELGDALDPDWQQKNGVYRPRDLTAVCSQAPDGRLPMHECLRIGIALLETLDFLHSRGLAHRDIKPSNVIFVNSRPKFADVGLVRELGGNASWVGTEFYMSPDSPGTTQADIYAFGKLLYVISTGNHPSSFAELSTALATQLDFMRLNEIICKACQPAAEKRYATAAEMLAAMRELQHELISAETAKIGVADRL